MKKGILKLVLLMFVITTTIGCSDDDADIVTDRLFASADASVKVLLKINQEEFDAIDKERKEKKTRGQDVTIKSAKRENDILKLEVNYSGGCSFHTFTVLWDGIVYTDPPCYMNLLILHYSDDNCEASITETIDINLKDLIGDVTYKDDCSYRIFTSFNATDTPNQEVKSLN